MKRFSIGMILVFGMTLPVFSQLYLGDIPLYERFGGNHIQMDVGAFHFYADYYLHMKEDCYVDSNGYKWVRNKTDFSFYHRKAQDYHGSPWLLAHASAEYGGSGGAPLDEESWDFNMDFNVHSDGVGFWIHYYLTQRTYYVFVGNRDQDLTSGDIGPFYKDMNSPVINWNPTPFSTTKVYRPNNSVVTHNGPGIRTIVWTSEIQQTNGSWVSEPFTTDGSGEYVAAFGTHRFVMTLTDNLGVVWTVPTTPFVIQHPPSVAPSFPTSVSLKLNGSGTGANQQFGSLTASWAGLTAATDADPVTNQLDQIGSVLVYVDSGSGFGQPTALPVATGVDPNSLTYTFAVTHGANYTVAVLAANKDGVIQAGGPTAELVDPQKVAASQSIPRSLVVGSVTPAFVDPSQLATSDYAVTVVLNATPAQLAAYASVQLDRSSGDPTHPLPASVLGPAVTATSSAILSGLNVPGSPWITTASGNIAYVDRIAATSRAGHRVVSYQVLTTLAGVTDTDGLASSGVRLPAHQGSATVTILDVNGVPYGSTGGAPFEVYGDGKVQVALQATDIDFDHWDYEIDKVVQTASGTATLASYTTASGSTKIGYDPGPTGYDPSLTPITIGVGTTNLQVFWVQGEDPASQFASDITALNLHRNSDGSYSLTVTSGYSAVTSNDVGVVVQPGQPLTLQLSPTTLDPTQISWDFGDGTTDSGLSVTHTYHQSLTQTSASVTQAIVVTLPDGTTLNLGATVQDTQYGTLYESEVWHGDHTVIGLVSVPVGLSLTIAANETISFQGGLGAGFQQGLQVSGTLTVGDGVAFTPVAGQTQGWGGLTISGQATFGSADIQRAYRAITLINAGAVSITNAKLHDNQVGLHVFGAGSGPITVTGSTFTNNSLYGIKEDAGGRPRLINSALNFNLQQYYSFDKGLIGLDAINALPGNSGNTETN